MTALPAPDLEGRRARVLSAIGERGALVLPATPEVVVARDTELPYRPDPNLLYLTGSATPGTVVVLCPSAEPGPFLVFASPRDEERERWTGPREGPAAVAERIGADAGFPIGKLPEKLPRLLERADTIYFPVGWGRVDVERLVLSLLVRGRRARQRRGSGPQALVDPGAVLDELRLLKDDAEIARLRRAADATVRGFERAREQVRPGAGEWEVQAAVEAEFRRATGNGPAFPTIAAAGASATVLHYTRNDARLNAGDGLLLDAGATVDGYHADVSRTWSIGEPRAAVRTLHEVVLRAKRAAADAVRPGATEADVHQAALRVLLGGMHDLELIDETPDAVLAARDERRHARASEAVDPQQRERRRTFSRYFPHRVSHWLGLEVHDVGTYEQDGEPRRLQPGMVLTIEPGLYVPDHDEHAPSELRGIGIRIEDDLLVTPDGHENLTAGVSCDL